MSRLIVGRAPGTIKIKDFHVNEIVQSAAYAAICPVGIFYLCEKSGFEVASSFGLLKPVANVGANNQLLSAARLQKNGLLLINDIRRETSFNLQDALLFGNEEAPVRFIAAAHVEYRQRGVCGLLVMADTAPHEQFNAAQSYILRTHAMQITALLELQTLRELDPLGAITDRFVDRDFLHLFESVVVNASDAIFITEAGPIFRADPKIIYCNAAFNRMTGYSNEDVLNNIPRILHQSKTDKKSFDMLQVAFLHREPIKIELFDRKKDGTKFWTELSVVPVPNENAQPRHWIWVQRDLTENKQIEQIIFRAQVAEEENQKLEIKRVSLETELEESRRVEARLNYIAFHDDLTSLYNRQFFMDRLAGAFERAIHDPDFRFAIMFVDLNKFKQINDSFGHRSGDLVLVEIADRLKTHTRPSDVVARIGGDEFALLVEGFEQTDFIQNLAEDIVQAVCQPMRIGKQEIFLACSVGSAQATKRYRLPEELLRDADIAMYHAKQKNIGYAAFSDPMRNDAITTLLLRNELQKAIIRNEFFLEFQPICRSSTKKILGLETLIRWQHPKRGLVFPSDFIGVSEEMGLMRPIGIWVLREACTKMRAWRDRFPALNLQLNVNIAASQLQDSRFVAQLHEILAFTRLEPHALQLEISENVFFQSSLFLDEVFQNIRGLGVRIALGNFGSGYSSLNYLDKNPVDTIKVDRILVNEMPIRERATAILKTIIGLGQALNIDIIVEGIEQETQLDALVAIGGNFAQGYFLGRPMSVNRINEALAEQYPI